MNVEVQIIPTRQLNRLANNTSQLYPVSIGVHSRHNFRTERHSSRRRPDKLRLHQVHLAPDGGITRLIVGEQDSMAQGINAAFTKHQPVIVRPSMAEPQALASTRRKACKAAVLYFIAAKPFLIEMRKHRVAPCIHANPTGKPLATKQYLRQRTFFLKIRMTLALLHPGKRSFNPHSVFRGFGKGREGWNWK